MWSRSTHTHTQLYTKLPNIVDQTISHWLLLVFLSFRFKFFFCCFALFCPIDVHSVCVYVCVNQTWLCEKWGRSSKDNLNAAQEMIAFERDYDGRRTVKSDLCNSKERRGRANERQIGLLFQSTNISINIVDYTHTHTHTRRSFCEHVPYIYIPIGG